MARPLHISQLGEDALYLIMKQLPLDSLARAALVCKGWSKVATDPRLWTSVTQLTLDMANIQCLRIPRLRLASITKVQLDSVANQVLEEMLSHKKAVEMVINPYVTFSKVNPNLLATVVAGMKTVTMERCTFNNSK